MGREHMVSFEVKQAHSVEVRILRTNGGDGVNVWFVFGNHPQAASTKKMMAKNDGAPGTPMIFKDVPHAGHVMIGAVDWYSGYEVIWPPTPGPGTYEIDLSGTYTGRLQVKITP